MKHGSLFSGIGGFDLAAQWMGWENVFHCEWNEFGQRILNHYWPDAETFTDITKSDFRKYANTVDIITGGFPCQPYSVAGKKKGKEDERHLWPEMLRTIREVQPSWVVGENVPGLLNWKRGMVLYEIKTDLESEGFEVFPPCILPACSLNAPHRRDRLWIVAHSDGNRKRKLQPVIEGNYTQEIGNEDTCGFEKSFSSGLTSNAECFRQQRQGRPFNALDSKTNGHWKASWSYDDGRWPTESPIRSRNDGLPAELDGITISKHREESLKGFGNAIVPQVVYEIFKAIEQYEKLIA